MQITAGSWRGRRIAHHKGSRAVRPTTARVREALFNIIGNDLTGATILDCFAGSGIIALEAISRGADSVISIEQHHGTAQSLKNICRQWELGDHWQIRQADVTSALPTLGNRHFSLLFADPPYRSDWSLRLLHLLTQHHITAEHIVVEEASNIAIDWPDSVTLLSTRRYGQSALHFLSTTDISTKGDKNL